MTLSISGRTALCVGIALISVLASHEALSETKYFATQSDWMGVKCSERQEEEGYLVIQKCAFPGANLPQVYNIVKRIEPDLRAELPAKSMKYGDFDDSDVMITYTYKNSKHLYIELFYRGGVTYVEIIEKKNETQATVTYSRG